MQWAQCILVVVGFLAFEQKGIPQSLFTVLSYIFLLHRQLSFIRILCFQLLNTSFIFFFFYNSEFLLSNIYNSSYIWYTVLFKLIVDIWVKNHGHHQLGFGLFHKCFLFELLGKKDYTNTTIQEWTLTFWLITCNRWWAVPSKHCFVLAPLI